MLKTAGITSYFEDFETEDRAKMTRSRDGYMVNLFNCGSLAFIIGQVFGASSQEGAQILEITPEAFRQRLSRGRKQISEFMSKNCGLVYPENPF